MTRQFEGKTAVITGSGRKKGLGEAIAKRLAGEGANIVLSDLGTSRDTATSDGHIGHTAEMLEIASEISCLARARGMARQCWRLSC